MSAHPADRPDGSETPGEVPDLPAGIGGTDPDLPPPHTSEDLAAAAALLTEAQGREPLLTLTDEQIAALDGYARAQFVAAPWLDEHPEQRRLASGIALRAMVASGQVHQRTEPGTGAPTWRAAPEITGCLVLRRTAPLFTTAERTVQTEQGPQVHRLHWYVHEAGVLEEEVSAAGLHRFTVLPAEAAASRLTAVLDPDRVARAGGAPLHVSVSALAGHPLAERLARTRALTVLTVVHTAEGSVQQLHAYALPDAVLTMEALDPGTEDPELEFREVDQADLQALASVLVGRAG